MAITAQQVKELRDLTGCGIMDCKKALIECDSDIEKVVKEVMAEKGPVLCVVKGSLHFDEIPKCISWVNPETGLRESAALENPYPFLTAEQMKEITEILYTDGR